MPELPQSWLSCRLRHFGFLVCWTTSYGWSWMPAPEASTRTVKSAENFGTFRIIALLYHTNVTNQVDDKELWKRDPGMRDTNPGINQTLRRKNWGLAQFVERVVLYTIILKRKIPRVGHASDGVTENSPQCIDWVYWTHMAFIATPKTFKCWLNL